ncbi:unnamed protein product [Ceutorhynchus assimilis]|uniref:Polypeptide N-acetylgalactosaminyltransferase 9 n=1 Tax=Ceutorhynchus assimilis TaxID=467358 RepID=A0A9N9N2M2_9CUCU|nr:unnamed protein product [Ceutorhynchus assimilis]
METLRPKTAEAIIRNLLLKLIVVVATAWFTVAMLVFRGSGSVDRPIAEPLQQEQRHLDRNEIGDGREPVIKRNQDLADDEAGPVMPFKMDETTTARVRPVRNEVDVLAPPQELPGEMGKAVVLPTNLSADVKKMVDDGWLKNAFNQYASDMISVHRTLPDARDEW